MKKVLDCCTGTCDRRLCGDWTKNCWLWVTFFWSYHICKCNGSVFWNTAVVSVSAECQ